MTAKPKGFSLIEVSMVLAISVVMMGVVAGVYNQRRNIASDDAAQQVASIVQTVQNEAKQGQGPASGAGNIVAGETLWGNSIQFSNSCAPSSKPCFVVDKLVKNIATAGIRSYETYQIVTPENFVFSYIAPDIAPGKVVVFRNSTGQVYVTGASFVETATSTYAINTAQAPYDSAQAKYTLTVSTNDISIKRQ